MSSPLLVVGFVFLIAVGLHLSASESDKEWNAFKQKHGKPA